MPKSKMKGRELAENIAAEVMKHYPSDYPPQSLEDATRGSGDGLADFLFREMHDTMVGQGFDYAVVSGMAAIDRALEDIQAVRSALKNLKPEDVGEEA